MKNKTGIIDLGLGNIKSVFYALEYLDGNPVYISSSKDLNKINRLVFPGVGSFDYGMKLIRSSDIFDNLSRFMIEKKGNTWVKKDHIKNHLNENDGNNKLSNKRYFIKTKEKVSVHAQKTSEQTDYVIL